MTNKLYIVGNGFDIHHGIPSWYQSFGEYLKAHDKPTYQYVERYFSMDGSFWYEFEDRLAAFDADLLIDDASTFLVSYAAEDWSDSFHHDYQYEITQVVTAISETMRARFADWIRELPIPDSDAVTHLRLNIDPAAKFLNFNYTPSLQRIYGIPNGNVLHIHGAATDPAAQLILGHAWEPEDRYSREFEEDPESADVRALEGSRIVDDYFRKTFKPTEHVIKDHTAFFLGLRDVNEILVMGHSLAQVDHGYFYEILRNIDMATVRWKISYYKDLEVTKSRFANFGINPALVQFLQLQQF